MSLKNIFLRALFALGCPLLLAAQSARWDPPGGALPAGQGTSLQLVFDGCEPKETPAPPRVDGLTLAFAGQSNSMSFINGTYSHTLMYNYTALLTRSQRVEIPAFTVETDKGRVRVPAARFEPTSATVGGGQPLAAAANSRLEAPAEEVWAGQVFPLTYSIRAARGYYPDFGRGLLDWNPAPLLAEDWTPPAPFEISPNGEPQTGLAYHTRAIARTPGDNRLNPVNQIVNLSVGVSGFGFFQQRQYQQFSVASDPATVRVRPLPPAPAGFSGAVGEFSLSSKIVPAKAGIGEPVTWTLELSGTGNWPDLAGFPEREVSKNFQVISPKAKRATPDHKLFDSKLTEDVVLVPTQAGRYDLRPVRFIYFDPKRGAYRTLTTEPAMVEVSAPAPAPASASPAAAAPAAGPAARPGIATLPSGLPRDPLTEAGTAAAPLTPRGLAALVLAPVLALLAFWLGLAIRRARRHDPARPRREARQRLAATLAHFPADGSAADAAAPLLAWQRDAAILWQVAHAAPTAAALADPAWSTLWTEADRALYGGHSALPADWPARARAALAARPAPRFAVRRVFGLRNLFPFLALAFAWGIGSAAFAAEPGPAYRSGDFASAEAGWRRTLGREPTAWAIRHDLSLALAQQNRWDEAAAQATAAFVQQPADEAVRWQFALACGQAGFVPGPLADFLTPGPRQWLARGLSPAAWQGVLAAAAALAALAAGALLAVGYGASRRWRLPAWIALGIAALGLLAAGLGWSAYGAAADDRAVVIWRQGTLRSIPTEADSSQKTTPLSAGSLGRADKAFLGWLRLNFDNGQTGWVRKEEVVWLWK